MNFPAFFALIRRDLRLFFMDKRAVTMSFVAPILIASFFGYLFGGVSRSGGPSKISVVLVDEDASEISTQMGAALAADPSLEVKSLTAEEARDRVRGGKAAVAAIFPKDFGARAMKAF